MAENIALSIVGMKPLYRCRSEPQMAVEVIFTIASRGLRIFGSGTVQNADVVLAVPAVCFHDFLLPGYRPEIAFSSDSAICPIGVRGPNGCPAVVAISPASSTCLRRRKFSCIMRSGIAPNSLGNVSPVLPAARLKRISTASSVPLAGSRLEPYRPGRLDGTVRQRPPRDEAVGLVRGDLSVPFEGRPRRVCGPSSAIAGCL